MPKKGWRKEPARHSLAAKGVGTKLITRNPSKEHLESIGYTSKADQFPAWPKYRSLIFQDAWRKEIFTEMWQAYCTDEGLFGKMYLEEDGTSVHMLTEDLPGFKAWIKSDLRYLEDHMEKEVQSIADARHAVRYWDIGKWVLSLR